MQIDLVHIFQRQSIQVFVHSYTLIILLHELRAKLKTLVANDTLKTFFYLLACLTFKPTPLL